MKKQIILVLTICLSCIFALSGCGGGSSAEGNFSCSVSVVCTEILENMDKLASEKVSLVPEDGIILDSFEVSLPEGSSAFDALVAAVRENKIHMEYSESPIYNTAYINGIGNIYEFDCGAMSGWMYMVNDASPDVGCSSCELHDGDFVQFYFSCTLSQ